MLLVLEIASLLGVVAEDLLDRLRLGHVAQLGAGAVGVDVVDVVRVPAGVAQGRAASPRRRPAPSGCGAVMWCASAVLPSRAPRRRSCAPRVFGVLVAPRAPGCRPPRRGRSRRGPCRTAGWRAAGRRCAATGRRQAMKPPRPIGVIAASVPPVIMTSAWSYWIGWQASPMAWAAEAQAVATAVFGPHQAELDRDVAAGRVGDHLGDDERADPARARRSCSAVCCSSNSFSPPMPLPMIDAAAERVLLGEVDAAVRDRLVGGDQGELREPVELAGRLGVERAVSGSKSLTSPPKWTLNVGRVEQRRSGATPLLPASRPCQ